MAESEIHELLFFRHSYEGKRDDGERALKLLREPFEHTGAASWGYWRGGGTFKIPFKPPMPLALIVAQFPKQQWLSIDFVGGSAQHVVDANKTVGRLEFLRLKFRGRRELIVVEVVKRGKQLACFSVSPTGALSVAGSDVPSELDGLVNAEDGIAVIRSYYGFRSPLRTLTTSGPIDTGCPVEFKVVKENEQILKPRACSVSIARGPCPTNR